MIDVKVSVLIPIYNVGRYLDQCLDSVVNQTLKDIEIICINDGSTDNSLSIIKKYASIDNRIIIIDKENTGYGDSMNLGLSMAKGKYIGIVESDDYIKHTMFEELYTIIHSNDLEVVGSFYSAWNDGYYITRGYLNNVVLDEVIDVVMYRKELIQFEIIWSRIYSKTFLLNNNIYFLSTPSASYQDVSFNYKVWKYASKTYISSTSYYNYRLDNPNSSVNSKDKVYAVHSEIEEVFRVSTKDDYSYAFDKLLSVYLYNYYRISDEYKDDFEIFMLNEIKKYDVNIDRDKLSEINKLLYQTYIENEDIFKLLAFNYNMKNGHLIKNDNHTWIEEINQYDKKIIYGAGIRGQRVGKKIDDAIFAQTSVDDTLACIDVENSQGEVIKKQIASIYDISDINDAVIIITPTYKYAVDMVHIALECGFQNIYYFNESLNKRCM